MSQPVAMQDAANCGTLPREVLLGQRARKMPFLQTGLFSPSGTWSPLASFSTDSGLEPTPEPLVKSDCSKKSEGVCQENQGVENGTLQAMHSHFGHPDPDLVSFLQRRMGSHDLGHFACLSLETRGGKRRMEMGEKRPFLLSNFRGKEAHVERVRNNAYFCLSRCQMLLWTCLLINASKKTKIAAQD